MVKKILLVAITVFCVLTSNAQTIAKHGLILGGGMGDIKSELKSLPDVKYSDLSYKSGYAIGYRLRLTPGIHPFFIDADANIGMKTWKSTDAILIDPASYAVSSQYNYVLVSASSLYYYASVGGTFNYSIYRGLSAGIGVEPTYYFSQGFDAPLIGKVAYDFGKFELGVSYKHGLADVITDRIKAGKFRDIQFSLFIPF
ncbi:MAG: hypothetical protein LBU37_04000 [Tannerellaceae bacterium]|jgi:hypothetical protein|nr:hypothetical protein [Tannerellaceae bacterium]